MIKEFLESFEKAKLNESVKAKILVSEVIENAIKYSNEFINNNDLGSFYIFM